MLYINIIFEFGHSGFIHMLDKDKFSESIHFYENSNEDILWDYLVVYEKANPNKKYRVKKGGLIFISGEPMDSGLYCKEYLDQFDHVISSHTWYKNSKNHISQQALPYHFGLSFKTKKNKYTFDDLINLPLIEKDKTISMVCSASRMMPGHIKRYNLYKVLRAKFNEEIDFYGSGIKLVDDKADAIYPYMFHICIENSADNHYWTEKIADSLLGYAVPIYYGAPNIGDYFPEEAIIKIDPNDVDRSIKIIADILQRPKEIYNEKLPHLLNARNLLLNKYNIFPMLYDFTKQYPSLNEEKIVRIKDRNKMPGYKIRLLKLRCRRLITKLLYR